MKIELEASGVGELLVTIRTPHGVSQRDKAGTVYYTHEYGLPIGGQLSVTAQRWKGSGPVGCKITIDGRVVSENNSAGQAAVAICKP
jgi:hypothetical protein